MKIKNHIALLLCLVFVLSLLFSATLILHEASHDCCGESCQICALISKCSENLEKAFASLSSISLFGVLFFAVAFFFGQDSSFFAPLTPVGLKVKLSD